MYCVYTVLIHSCSARRNILEQLGSNDNIVRYHERFVDKPNNMLYILMEYCEGGDLAGVINRCRNSGYVALFLFRDGRMGLTRITGRC